MSIGELVVQEAAKWIGTPYRHQASKVGVGTDCLGLVRGIWRALYGAEPEVVPAYTPDWSEAHGEEQFLRAALRHLVPARSESPGQVILFRMRSASVAKHLGISSGTADLPKFIHAYSGHGVIENALTRPWARRIVARFDFPQGD